MKNLILFCGASFFYIFIILLLLRCGTSKEDKKILSIVQTEFPLTYQMIDKNAKDKFGENKKKTNIMILNQCESFILVGNMLLDPEKNCGVDKKAFGTFFILASLENTNIKVLTPERIFRCIKCHNFDERFSCMDLDWNGVLKSLMKQIIEYKKIEIKKYEPQKNSNLWTCSCR